MKKSIKSSLSSTRLLRMETLENRQLLDAASILSNATPDAFVVAATETADDPVDLQDLTNGEEEETGAELTVVASDTPNWYVVSWDAYEDAAAYRVKVSKNGGETWVTYLKSTEDTSFTAQGVYVGKAWSYRVFAIDANGKASSDYFAETTIAPVSLADACLTYTDGDTISIALKGAKDADGNLIVSADTTWYEIDSDGNETEISEAAGLFEYTPTSRNTIKVVATGTGYSTGSSAELTVTYTAAPVVELSDYNPADRTATVTWEADPSEAVVAYNVKISKDGGETWITYRKIALDEEGNWASDKEFIFDADSNEFSISAQGLYVKREYAFRVYPLPEGSTNRNYNLVYFTPFGLAASAETCEAGTPISISMTGADSAAADVVWYYDAPAGLVEIEGTTGLTEITPEYSNYNIVCVVTGVDNSKGEEVSVNFAAVGSNVYLGDYDFTNRSVDFAWDPMLDAASYRVEVSCEDESFAIEDVTDTTLTVPGIYGGKSYSLTATGYNADGLAVGTSQVGTIFPFGLFAPEVYNEGEAITVTLVGPEDPCADVYWYSVDENGDQVEIEEARGLTEYYPSGGIDVVVKAVGVGVSEGQTESAIVYYRGVPEDPSTVVTSLGDVVDGRDGVVTLREAIEVYSAPGDTITFDPSVAGGVITLNGTSITIASDLTIDASALETPVTIDAGSRSRIFSITAESVAIDGVVFANGKSTGSGGAITASESALSISNSVFTGSQAKGLGGAIYLFKGSLDLTNVLAYGNDAVKGGSVVYAKTAPVNVYNATIAGNSATTGAALEGTTGEFNLYNTIVVENDAADIATTTGAVNAFNVLSGYADWSNENAVSYAYDASAPLFNSDYTLVRTGDNQAIDKGDSQYVSVAVDLNGEARIKGNTVDLGAFEADVEDASTVVTTLDDVVNPTDFVISLREAITSYAAAGDTITFDSSLDGQTITLGGEQIVISKNVTIDGSALANGIVVSGGSANRVFRITATDATIVGVDFVDGYRDGENGGTIYCATNAGLTLKDSTISGGYAVNGGAIYASTNASVALDGVTLSGNTATTQGGAIYLGSNATLTATNSTFTGNAGGARGGVFSAANGNTVEVVNSTFSGNNATRGAAFYTTSATNVTIAGSTISDNVGAEKGGAVYSSATGTITLTDTNFSGNTGGAGAVITITNGTVNGTNVNFTNNTSTGDGGALRAEGGSINITGTAITGNSAVNGGAIAPAGGSINLTNARIASNRASGNGAVVYSTSGSYTLVNALLNGNNNGNFVIYTTATANMVNITLAENDALGVYSTGSSTLRNSIVWNNGPSNFQTDGGVFTVSNVLTQTGRSSGSTAVTGTFWESDNEAPYNSSFQLKSNWISEEGISPINSGNNSYNSTSADLAGNTRVVGGTIDLGPYEYQSSSSAVLDEVFADGLDDLFED